jgi:hypothetical protein
VRLSPFLVLSLALALAQPPQTIGFKIVTQNSFGVGSSETTAYYLSDRSRVEHRFSEPSRSSDGSVQASYGPRTAMIRRCDLGKMFFLNLATREYSESTDPAVTMAKALAAAKTKPKSNRAPPSKPTLRIETTTADTGERKQMFGYTARRVIYTQKYVPLEGSTAIAQETTQDGWYVDIDTNLSCDVKFSGETHAHLVAVSNRNERIDFVDKGTGRLGFPVSITATLNSSMVRAPSSAQKSDQTVLEVTDLQKESLEPALFEIPPGFKLVKNINPNLAPLPARSRAELAWQRFKLWLSNAL